ncbi:MAG: hypothetical protein WC644_12705 [Ignavibacteria bacterium]
MKQSLTAYQFMLFTYKVNSENKIFILTSKAELPEHTMTDKDLIP